MFPADKAGLILALALMGPVQAEEIPPPILKTIELEWEDVAHAESYLVRLTPQSGAPPLDFTTTEPRLSEQIPVGIYELRVRSKSKEAEVYSKWSDPVQLEVAVKETKPVSPPDKALIEARTKSSENIEFSWTPVEKVKAYTITIWTNDSKDKPLEFTTQKTAKNLTVKTGREYFWQVRFESATDISYAQAPPVFSFTLVGSKLITPGGLSHTRAGEELNLTWKPSEDATEYEAELFFRFLDETEYRSQRKVKLRASRWSAGKLGPGAYKLKVIAKAAQRVDSDPAVYEFSVKPLESQILRR